MAHSALGTWNNYEKIGKRAYVLRHNFKLNYLYHILKQMMNCFLPESTKQKSEIEIVCKCSVAEVT